ncbi:MAG: bifunctional ADP-dependent NAD(P)H-hydrate dehydratase/NAD(P)H-hydrate epimerase [Epsilonproteobacteria bacterium]|nr:MAG: bifunctional ADP-dependent NAD(P)H-hydrate dehydratase/NAD(P)H-hydrate epimerase [Campylobacterota bacterium]
MQKVFESCDALDKKCYERYGLSEDILMEHAACGMASYIRKYYSKESSILIVAGKGNNGADGIVLARQLHGEYNVKLFIVSEVKSKMAKIQLERAMLLGVPCINKLEDAEVIVDAIYGSGLNRELNESTAYIIHQLNAFKGKKIACDTPTGMGSSVVFVADITITMGARTEALYLDGNKDSIGEVFCANLGLSALFYESESQVCLLEESDLNLPSRTRQNSHKGNYGHAVVFCGEKEGAGLISGMSAATFGAGITTLVAQEHIALPAYLMHSTVVPGNASALAIGMGLGGHFESKFLQKYVLDSSLPIVLDADSFYSEELLKILEQKDREIVLTPHPKEFVSLWKILTGEQLTVTDIQAKRFEVVRNFNAKYPHVTLLLKGANTIIMQKEHIYINPLGCSKLSKGGSGDVLSGLIVSLLAQGYTAVNATIQASLALVMGANRYRGASYAMLPTDLIREIGELEEK